MSATGRRRIKSAALPRKRAQRPTLARSRLDNLIAEALVDAYSESEQRTAWATVLETQLGLPAEATLLGVPVIVERIDLNAAEDIVAICRRGRHRRTIPLLDLPQLKLSAAAAQWLDAYRRWARPT